MLNEPLQYLWVYQWDAFGRCLASAERVRNEAPVWVDPIDYHVDPDLDMGIPVFRRTVHGLAQYFRFESIQSREKYDQRRAA